MNAFIAARLERMFWAPLVLSTTIAPLPQLDLVGMDFVDPQGETVVLQGCNVGNWLMLEMWMYGGQNAEPPISDQHELFEVLESRFGRERKEALMDVYRSHYIQQSDFDTIASFGFNSVRLPFDYRLLEHDETPFQLREDAFEWLDLAIDMAERSGLYTILDLHGVQGGQSAMDHSGRSGQNRLWDEPLNQDRLVWLWQRIAERYKDRSAVAAYDLINEPYGGDHEGQMAIFDRLVHAVRAEDDETPIFVAAHWDGFAHYGDPAENGWTRTGFTEHHYPGLFGGGAPTLLTHARHLRGLPDTAARIAELDVPFLIGEMNVVFDAAGGPAMMRRHYDTHASFGWSTTMWSYKVLSAVGGFGDTTWAMVTSENPWRLIDVRTASYEAIEAHFRSFSSEPMAVNERLRDALTASTPPELILPEIPEPVLVAPADDPFPNWAKTDISARPGGLVRLDDDRFELWGGGEDIWGTSDGFRFLHRPVFEHATLEVTVESLADVAGFAKAGLMVRASLAPDSATVLLSTFPNGELQFAVRTADGAEMSAGETVQASLPVQLRLLTHGSSVEGLALIEGAWVTIGTVEGVDLGPSPRGGVVALSHNDNELVRAVYSGLWVGAHVH